MSEENGRIIDNHYLPITQILAGLPGKSSNPNDLASVIEYQVDRATDSDQKLTITMSLSDGLALAKLLRRAGLMGI